MLQLFRSGSEAKHLENSDSKQACIYWVKLQEHDDPMTQGYIGVSTSFKTRMRKHEINAKHKKTHLHNAINKYGWDVLVKEILFVGNEKECYAKEKEYRSEQAIGWNCAVGGIGGDRSLFIDYSKRINKGWCYDKRREKNPFYNKKHTEEAALKIKKAKCKTLIKIEDCVFYGFNSLAKHLNVHKQTAKKIALANGWYIESK